MLRKTNSKGFTIIEVVITIAIGAAVMALVLNAVAGARRSQRNNARLSDVNQVAAGINQYIAARNKLPASWAEISTLADNGSKFGHYAVASVNPEYTWNASQPSTDGAFPVVGKGGINVTPGACSVGSLTPLGKAGCELGVDGLTSTSDDGTWTGGSGGGPLQTGDGIGGPGPAAFDKFVVIRKAGCSGTEEISPGGIREMAITYRLEGQTNISCLEI